MSISIGIPPSDSLVDRQFIEIPGPDGTTTSYQYDKETNTVIRKESQIIIPAFHGATHVSQDPIPEASQFLRGLMSAEDKARFDAMTQTRLGVLGFQGAGFPDDGGFLQGDIILAAGSEFISLERVGNVVRFTVDNPIPLSCNCEECAQIFWIQDESETRAVRPPSCNGVMPDATMYGEMRVYSYPSSTIFNPNDPLPFFERKGEVPALLFKRYENGNDFNTAQLEMVLKRRSEDMTSNVGWSMTPGPEMIPECIWYMGSDREGRQLTMEFKQEQEAGMLGALLYNGATITRRDAVIVGYDTNVLENNLYQVQMWNIQDAETIGEVFMAQNTWKYTNPEGGDATPTMLSLDRTIGLLDIGQIVDLYQFRTSNVNGKETYQSFFALQPNTNPRNVWAYTGGVKFGEIAEQRVDADFEIGVEGTGTEKQATIDVKADVRLFEKTQWGVTNLENDLLLPGDGDINSNDEYEPGGTLINNNNIAVIDYSIPGLVVTELPRDNRGDLNGDDTVDQQDLQIMMQSMNTSVGDPNFNEDADLNNDGKVDVRDLAILGTNMNIAALDRGDRPVWLWHRQTHNNFLMEAMIGQPTEEMESFPPLDIVMGGPIDHVADEYCQIIERGVYETGPFAKLPWIKVDGLSWDALPSKGALRILTGVYRDIVWNYQQKIWDGNSVRLVGHNDIFPFDEDFIIEYNPPNPTGGNPPNPTGGNPTDVTVGPTPPLVPVPTNTVVTELLHSDYTAPALRLQFSINRTPNQESVELRVTGGTLSMATPYKFDDPEAAEDDFVRGFLPGEYSVSNNFIQQGFITDGIGADVPSNPPEFRVYEGGFLPAPVGDQIEKWNQLLVMKRDNQLWLWWNGWLITPDPTESAKLPVPVAVSSPYFPIDGQRVSKVGFRMWPGTVIRSAEVSDQNTGFNEYTLGQLQLKC